MTWSDERLGVGTHRMMIGQIFKIWLISVVGFCQIRLLGVTKSFQTAKSFQMAVSSREIVHMQGNLDLIIVYVTIMKCF